MGLAFDYLFTDIMVIEEVVEVTEELKRLETQ
jgi:hypothetical protein